MRGGHDTDRALYSEYRRVIEGEPLTRALRIAVIVLFVIQTVFIGVDHLFFPGQFARFLSVRLALDVGLVVIYFGTSRRHPLASAYATVFAGGAMLLTVVHGTGGAISGYYVGLVLLFLGIGVLSPLTATQAAIASGAVFATYAGMPWFDGGPIPWQTFGVHLFFLGSAAFGGVMSCMLFDRMRFADFRQRREIERARDELKSLDREKERFTANVHHELRTPLTLTLVPLEAMLAGQFGDVTASQRDTLETMHTHALRLLKLINDLLDLAKIEGRQQELVRSETALGPIIEGLVHGALPLAQRKGITLETRQLDALPRVHVDASAFEKVIVNLLGNALKFTDRGGCVVVTGGTGDDGGAHLVVSDTGIGLAPDQLDRVFDRFRQVDASATRRYEGTGIGLTLTRELVQLHGGRVWAESEGLGRGASLHVELPVGEADTEASESVIETSTGSSLTALAWLGALAAVPDSGDARLLDMRRNTERHERARGEFAVELPEGELAPPTAPRVVVAEDNADMRRLLGVLLGREFRVQLTRNGCEALAAARAEPPALILTDIMMPEMSGIELCHAIKSDPETAGIPVMLVTSKAEREMKIEGLELGADDYVAKPFHPRELLARVRALVRLRELQASVEAHNQLLESTNQELADALGELKDTSAQLVQAERLAAVGELAAGVAHEVNNPMNFASNALRALEAQVEQVRCLGERAAALNATDPAALAEQTRELERLRQDLDLESLAELVAIIGEGLERTRRLVGDLRDFASPGQTARTDLDVRAGLESTLHLIAHSLRDAGIRLETDLADRVPLLFGDGRALNQVFLNLLKNATEALRGRGGTVSVYLGEEDGSIVVRVADDGPGIPPECLGRLFEPFYTTKRAGDGTGLGLAISRRIVSDHGGSIEVESTGGEGSRFCVRLPIRGDANRPDRDGDAT
jgi:signal transduction histidine kinase